MNTKEMISHLHELCSHTSAVMSRDTLTTIADRLEASEALLTMLKAITAEGQSWHDFHHGTLHVGCDEICELLPSCHGAISQYENANL